MIARRETTSGSLLPQGGRAKNDVIFIVGLLVLTLLAGAALLLLKSPGDTVLVSVDGDVWGEFPLNEDVELEIPGANGGYNILVIKDGQAHVAQASCPDGICAAHRPISRDGESIICLPNKVVVELRATGQNQPDIIS